MDFLGGFLVFCLHGEVFSSGPAIFISWKPHDKLTLTRNKILVVNLVNHRAPCTSVFDFLVIVIYFRTDMDGHHA